MRVKKLNANRRPKAGEDDADAPQIGSPSPWTSPTKDASSYSPERAVDAIDIGADSPTDPTATPHAHDVSDLDLHHSPAMANAHAAKNGGASTPTPGASAPSWRDRVDRALRESVHQKIVEYLSTLKPNAPAKVLEKLPGLAYRMEEGLFKLASSEEEYRDQSTLPQRLTLIQQANAKRLLQQQCPPGSPKAKEAISRPPQSRQPLNEAQARVVFSCLQTWRQKLVNMYGATPWEILPNKILAKVAVFIPSTTQELVVCGVPNEQLERFGNSLLQEIEKVMNALNANASAAAAQQLQMNAARVASPPGSKRPSPSGGKANGQSKARATNADQANKKRKTSIETAPTTASLPTSAVRLAAAPTGLIPPSSYLTTSASLIRPMDPAFLAAAAAASSLPALLPSGANGQSNGKTAPFFPRIPVPTDQDNRMHLLAQGVGQLSKQQEQQTQHQDPEKEIQALRWLLQESQRQKAELEAEVQRLRQQGAK